MKKSFTVLVASVLECSMVFGSPTANEPSFTGLNATEHAALFGEGSVSQVVALDSAEMKATEGEWIYVAIWGGYQLYRIGSIGFRTYRTIGPWYRGSMMSGSVGYGMSR